MAKCLQTKYLSTVTSELRTDIDVKTILTFIFVFIPFFLSYMFIVERRDRIEYEKCTLALEEDCITEFYFFDNFHPGWRG